MPSVQPSPESCRRLFSSQLRINMLSGVIATILNVVALAVAYPVYLHYLGYEIYGVWLVLATVLQFAQVGDLGINQAVMKLVAEEHGRKNLEGIQRYVTTALIFLFLNGAIVLLVILMLKSQVISAFKLSVENAVLVSWLLPYIGLLSLYVLLVQALNATLSGMGRMDLANYIQVTGRIFAVCVATLLLFLGRGIESLLIGNTLSYILIHTLSIWFIHRIAEIRFLRHFRVDYDRLKILLRFGSGVMGGSLVNLLLHPFNRLMLSRYSGVSAIPVYDIAFNGAMQVRALAEVALRAIMPEISRIGSNITPQGHKDITNINRNTLKLIIICCLPIYSILIFLRRPLLKLWLGQKFTDALLPVFALMLVATFLSLLCVCAYYTLLGLGKVRHIFLASVVKVITNVSLVAAFIIITGTISVYSIAWSVMVALGMTTIYVLWQKQQVMKRILLV